MSTVSDRLDQLAARYALRGEAVSHLSALLAALEAPNAPTKVHERSLAVDIHVADALSALELPGIRAARLIADIGAGAGLPGLVLAAALPEAEVKLIESTGKKCEFITTTAEAMDLSNAKAVWARAEEWAHGRERCDLVTARALAPLPVICEYAAPLLRLGGLLVAWKGDVPPEEERDGHAAAHALGIDPLDVHPVKPYPGSRNRHLYTFRKTAATPDRFPRRAGIAAKRPLSATRLA